MVHERESGVIEWAALVLGTAMASVLAFLLNEARCGTARLAATPVSSSGYCHALGAPGLPSRLGSAATSYALVLLAHSTSIAD